MNVPSPLRPSSKSWNLGVVLGIPNVQSCPEIFIHIEAAPFPHIRKKKETLSLFLAKILHPLPHTSITAI